MKQKTESQNLTFRQFYNEIKHEEPEDTQKAKRKFIEKIAEISFKTVGTVRMWLYTNYQVPDQLTQKIVSEHMGIPAENLFPPKN